MKKTVHSLGHALSGLAHAMRHEVNLRSFVLAQVLLILICVWIQMGIISIISVLIYGAMFMVVELLNTAIERLADTVDDCEKQRNGGHYHAGIKMTKDVAAAASLIALIIYGWNLVFIFIPYLSYYFHGY